MGIVNVTPDSFFDGGRDASAALMHCEKLVREGADVLDIGGESTRPGAVRPGSEEELKRVMQVVRHALNLGVPVSVDTSDADVIDAVLEAGADIINDVRSFTRPGALESVSRHAAVGLCIMHMHGEPDTMQRAPAYQDDVVVAVGGFLRERAAVLESAGIARERIVVDPGIGFGKTAEHNLEILARQSELAALPYPLLVGWSRKSTLGAITGREVQERLAASLAAALLSAQRGARILRVHDVAATVDALKVWHAAGTTLDQNVAVLQGEEAS